MVRSCFVPFNSERFVSTARARLVGTTDLKRSSLTSLFTGISQSHAIAVLHGGLCPSSTMVKAILRVQP